MVIDFKVADIVASPRGIGSPEDSMDSTVRVLFATFLAGAAGRSFVLRDAFLGKPIGHVLLEGLIFLKTLNRATG